MPKILPPKRPEAAREFVEALLAEHKITERPVLVGRRGYYRDAMGEVGENDWNLYDDAIWLVADGVFRAFNANTDPSRSFPGVAVLRPGKWRYRPGIHGLSRPPAERYPALVQAGEVTVDRVLQKADTGFFGINIHRGGYNVTSSLGCQTIHPDQWREFYREVTGALKRSGHDTLWYLLTAREAA